MNSTQSDFIKSSTFCGNSFDGREDESQSNQANLLLKSHMRRFYEAKEQYQESESE